MNKAVFIDKDGTLVEDVPYNVDPEQIRFTRGATDALRTLKDQGFLLIVVSNQSGIARGYFNEESLEQLRHALDKKLRDHNVAIDGFEFCPHHPEGTVPSYSIDCACRKPKPGMIISAAEKFNIDLPQSWMIGDILNDVEAGNRAGCKTILINNGNETEWKFGDHRLPTAIVTDLPHAAKRIAYEPELV